MRRRYLRHQEALKLVARERYRGNVLTLDQARRILAGAPMPREKWRGQLVDIPASPRKPGLVVPGVEHYF